MEGQRRCGAAALAAQGWHPLLAFHGPRTEDQRRHTRDDREFGHAEAKQAHDGDLPSCRPRRHPQRRTRHAAAHKCTAAGPRPHRRPLQGRHRPLGAAHCLHSCCRRCNDALEQRECAWKLAKRSREPASPELSLMAAPPHQLPRRAAAPQELGPYNALHLGPESTQFRSMLQRERSGRGQPAMYEDRWWSKGWPRGREGGRANKW